MPIPTGCIARGRWPGPGNRWAYCMVPHDRSRTSGCPERDRSPADRRRHCASAHPGRDASLGAIVRSSRDRHALVGTTDIHSRPEWRWSLPGPKADMVEIELLIAVLLDRSLGQPINHRHGYTPVNAGGARIMVPGAFGSRLAKGRRFTDSFREYLEVQGIRLWKSSQLETPLRRNVDLHLAANGFVDVRTSGSGHRGN